MSSKGSEYLRRTFALRLGLYYAGLFTISAITLLAFTYLLLARALAAQDHDVLESMLSRYTVEFEHAGLTGLRSLVEADAGEGRHERLLVRVINNQTEVIYFSTPPGWTTFDLSQLDEAPALSSGWSTIDNPPDGSVLEIGTLNLSDGVTVQVGRSSRIRDELLGNFRARAFEVLTLILVIGMAGGVFLTYAGLAPLRALEVTLRSILQTGQFDARVATRGSRDSLDELGVLVNSMLSRLQTLLAGMRGALDNVAHDLRTPLTRFRNVAEAALVAGDGEAVREGLALALEEADTMNATLTALMDISEAETGIMALTPQRFVLADVVQEAVALYADEAEDKGLTLQADVSPTLELAADRIRVRQVLANLIENAVKYTGTGGRVDVSARETGGAVTTTVRDTGIGISAADLPFVWDRLYRADASRSVRGLGLGLSLVKAIVEAHGGRVEVVSSPGAGSTFSVILPMPASRVRPASAGQ